MNKKWVEGTKGRLELCLPPGHDSSATLPTRHEPTEAMNPNES